MTTILDKIAHAHYVATDAQVEQLAAAQYEASQRHQSIDGTYLRVLIAGCQAKLGTAKRGRSPGPDAQMSVIELVHAKYYAAVLRGVTTPEVAAEDGLDPKEKGARALERNRRSNFARSAKLSLAAFVRGGGDVRGIDVETASKAGLRVKAPAVTPAARTARTEANLLRAVQAQAKRDAIGARRALTHAIAALQRVLAGLHEAPIAEAPTLPGNAVMGHRRTRAGVGVMA